jgi:peptide/nickel transport system permease protein
MFRGIESRDYPLMMGAFLLITVAVVIGIYIADLTYGKIDPRAGTGSGDREAY